MNEYTARYFTGTNRYDRRFYTGGIKAANMVEAVAKAQRVAERKDMEVAGVARVFSN